jgi:hypothetical protein
MGLSLMNTLGLCQVYVSHTHCMVLKIIAFTLYIQVIFRSRFGKSRSLLPATSRHAHWSSLYNVGTDLIGNIPSNSCSIVACVSVAVETC